MLACWPLMDTLDTGRGGTAPNPALVTARNLQVVLLPCSRADNGQQPFRSMLLLALRSMLFYIYLCYSDFQSRWRKPKDRRSILVSIDHQLVGIVPSTLKTPVSRSAETCGCSSACAESTRPNI